MVPNGKKARHFPPQQLPLRGTRVVLCGSCGTHGWGGGVVRQVSHIRDTRRAFSSGWRFKIQTPTAVLSRRMSRDIHGLRAGDWDDIRFQGSPDNARLVLE
mgnify:CR=1 FL=1